MSWFDKAHWLNINGDRLLLDLGWYPGDPFTLLSINIGGVDHNHRTGAISLVQVLSVQVWHFAFTLGWWCQGETHE